MILFLGSCLAMKSVAQTTEPKAYSDFPIIITLQFHAFTLPFRDIKANFSNLGIGVGTEWRLNSEAHWVQQLNLIWYHNKALGNGITSFTQAVWRPGLDGDTYGELKAGVGYLYSFRPAPELHQINGKWISSGRQGKGMLAIPVGVSLGYNMRSTENLVSNFVTYQFLLIKDYNKSIPIVPETLLQVGSRIHF